VVTVRNSGHYEPGQVKGNGIGLRNTRKRLELIYGSNARITIGNKDGMVETQVEFPINEQQTGLGTA
jgi:LytS/YehU family sensor histidine kinase